MTAPWIMRPSTRAVSLIGSPRPNWMSLAFRKRLSPPISRMPTSNETRVRVEDLEKISAQVWPVRWVCVSPLLRLRAVARWKILSTSAAVSCSIERRCWGGFFIRSGCWSVQASSRTSAVMAASPSSASLCRRLSAGSRRMIWVPEGMVRTPRSWSLWTIWRDAGFSIFCRAGISG